MKIPWTDRETNAEVLNMVGEEKCLVKEIRLRQLKFFGHVMRRGLESRVVTGLIEGSRGKGRPRDKYIDGLARAVGRAPVVLIRKTRDRRRKRLMAANVLEDRAPQLR